MESTVVWQTRYGKKNTITDMLQPTLTLKVTTAQVLETSVTVNDNRLSPIQDYVRPEDHTQPSYSKTVLPMCTDSASKQAKSSNF